MSSVKVVHLVLGTFTHDQRVLRAAYLAHEMGAESVVIAREKADVPTHEWVGPVRVQRVPLVTSDLFKARPTQVLKYLEAILRFARVSVAESPTLIHANDLNTLPVGYLVARMVNARLLYDSHELWSGAMHRDHFPRWMYELGLKMEASLARRADAVITVSESIAEVMRERMCIPKPCVVRNVPDEIQNCIPAEKSPLRRALGIQPNVPVLLYQGRIGRGRGTKMLLEAMKCVNNSEAVLVFLGNGALVSELKAKAEMLGVIERVYFHPAVPPKDLPYWTAGATIGVVPIQNMCRSYELCLPNKLFEFVQAGLPVIATDLPEMSRLIKEKNIGVTFKDGDPCHLASIIDRLLHHPEQMDAYRKASRKAAKELNWTKEKKRLMHVYGRLLSM